MRSIFEGKRAEMAETEGFEPSVPNYQYDGLANRWFQPLTHVSGSQRRGRAIARHDEPGKGRKRTWRCGL